VPQLPPEAAELAEALLGGIKVVPQVVYIECLDMASHVLTEAAASRNGSVGDAHLLACAWTFDADVWSHDRDFAGTGWPMWSNASLYRAMGAKAKRDRPTGRLHLSELAAVLQLHRI
jgi:PIN domain